MNSVKQLVIVAATLAGTAAVLFGCTIRPVTDSSMAAIPSADPTPRAVNYADYYFSIRENAEERISSFLAKQH
jgi:hypothetical protein